MVAAVSDCLGFLPKSRVVAQKYYLRCLLKSTAEKRLDPQVVRRPWKQDQAQAKDKPELR